MLKWFKKTKQKVQPLSAEADTFLAEATREFKEKQRNLDESWRFGSYTGWCFYPETSVLALDFADGARLEADGQLLGTFCVSDSSFEWAWNNPRFAKHLVQDSLLVKKAGTHLGLRYVQEGLIPVPGEAYLSYLSAIGLKTTGAQGVFRGGEGDVHPIITIKNPRWT